ncbi:hypothetical protein F2Q70_00025809 [Brassica cretica]|uniref:Uncharacterized protein n=1 Tax=Brassica cretica TaxID=69181 RepID=A0A8S9IDR6_BRACR|nr:hypothetical protein F2Q68_00025212 [Brassica cretica]KAF2604791.1 hypothetical protein F2Q70_00025809 [Brassica cretica]
MDHQENELTWTGTNWNLRGLVQTGTYADWSKLFPCSPRAEISVLKLAEISPQIDLVEISGRIQIRVMIKER